MMCRGTTVKGLPCRISRGLDSDGYCMHHRVPLRLCKGTVVENDGTTRPCLLRDDQLDEEGYCRHHFPPERQCKGFVGDNEERRRCKKEAVEEYGYCSTKHDPNFVYYPPTLFDFEGLRKEKENAIVRRWKNTDPYHDAPLPKDGYAMQLDHIIEKQCFSYGLTLLKPHNDEEAVETAIGALHDIVHSCKNLCFTLATTNVIKGQACTAYLEDSLIKLVVPEYTVQPFTDYLLAKKKDDSQLDRKDTRRIRKTMGRAVKSCRRMLDSQGDTPVLERLSTQFKKLYADMELHVSDVD